MFFTFLELIDLVNGQLTYGASFRILSFSSEMSKGKGENVGHHHFSGDSDLFVSVLTHVFLESNVYIFM